MTTPTPNIHDLMDAIRAHPDYVFGTVWTREDVVVALLDGEDDDDPNVTAAWLDKLTDEQIAAAEMALENYTFEGAYSFGEAIRDNVPAGEFPAGVGARVTKHCVKCDALIAEPVLADDEDERCAKCGDDAP